MPGPSVLRGERSVYAACSVGMDEHSLALLEVLRPIPGPCPVVDIAARAGMGEAATLERLEQLQALALVFGDDHEGLRRFRITPYGLQRLARHSA